MSKLIIAVLLLFSFNAISQTRMYEVYFDLDNRTATGCQINHTGLPDINGIEHRLSIETQNQPPFITATTQSACNGANFDPATPATLAALGTNTGDFGEDVFEVQISETELGINASTRVRLHFAVSSAGAEDIVSTQASGAPIILGFTFAVPTLGIFSLLLLAVTMLIISRFKLNKSLSVLIVLIAISPIVYAMTIMIDGQTGDWANYSAVATDPTGDTSQAGNYADLTQVYALAADETIYLRMDVVDVENQAPTITTSAAVNVVENQTAVIDVDSMDPNGDIEGVGLTYAITGVIDDGLFTIDPNTGMLSFIAAPDFETPTDVGTDNVYDVQLTVSDSGGLTAVQDLVVTVTNDVLDDTSVSFQTATSSTNDEATALNIIVELSALAPLSAPLSIDVVDAAGGSATDGTDYNSIGTQTITFPIGATNGNAMNAVLRPVDDVDVENNETVNLQLQNITGSGLIGAQSTHTVTITEDDVASVEFDTAASASTDESTALDVAVRLNIPSGGQLAVAVTVDGVDAGGGSATSATDYSAFGTQTATFPAGSMDAAIQNMTLTPLDDPASEGDETVNLQLQNVMGPASLGAQSIHQATITDDEASVAFQSASGVTVNENSALNVVVSLSTPIPLSAPLMVDVVDLGGGTAISGSDYTTVGTQTLTFPLGATNGTTMNAVLTPVNDNNVENNETVNLGLQNLVGLGSIGTQSTHTVTITEDDVASVEFDTAASASTDESTALDVAVRLNIPSGGQLAVAVTVDGADAGGGSATSATDYTAFGTQTVTFAAGSMNAATQNTTLTPLDDSASEGDETVNLQLQNVAGPVLANLGVQTTHTATITDDDNSPPVAMDDTLATDEDSNISQPIATGLLSNDTEPDMDPLVITMVDTDMTAPFTVTGSNGGALTVLADGSYTYDPTGSATLQALPVGSSLQEMFSYTISDGMFTDMATLTITINGVNDAPTAVNDPPVTHLTTRYETVGNTTLQLTQGAATSPVSVTGSLLSNDTDIDNSVASLTATAFVGTGNTAMGGDVQVFSNGEFIYTPPAGMRNVNDSFSYTVNDPDGGSNMGIVNLQVIDELVYYVDNTAGAGGTGTSSSRFDQLSDVLTAVANTTVYVFQGVGNTTGGLTVGDNTRLLGSPEGLTFNPLNGVSDDLFTAAAGRPTLSGTVTLANNNQLRSIDFNVNGVVAIVGTGVGNLLLNDVAVNVVNPAGSGVSLQGATASANMVFDSISVNGGTNGIVLSNSTGNFSVTGDGATTGARGGNGSGGTIQNTSSNGITLTNVSGINLNHMNINSSAINAIQGLNVSDFVLNRSILSSNGNAVNEGGFRFTDLFGTSAITNSVITGSAEHNARIVNSSGVLTQLLVDNSTISNNSATLGADGILFEANGAAGNATIIVQNSTLDGNRSDAIQIAAEDNSNINFTATGNILRNGARAITLSTGDNADLSFNISNNTEISGFSSPNSGEEAINVTTLSTTTAGSLMSGVINNNGNITNSGGFVGLDSRGIGDLTISITNNTATTSRQVIDAIFGDPGLGGTSGSGQNVHFTVLNNVLTATGIPSSMSNEGIALEAGTSGPTICMNISGNNATASGSREGLAIVDAFPTANPNFTLEGVGSNATTILNANNTLNGGIFIEPTIAIVSPGTCLTP